MISKWKVINTHKLGFTHKEKFRDELLEIKADEYILMDYEDAVQFKGQYFPMVLNAQGVQDPISYKMIKIEAEFPDHEDETKSEKVYVCHVDGKEFPNKDLLEKYIKENFSHLIFTDEAIEADNKKRKK